MNENLINTLAKKALEDYTYSDCDGDNNRGIRLNEKKFAKLVIKECIDMCDEVKYHIEQDFIDPEFGPTQCINLIKTHFGIE